MVKSRGFGVSFTSQVASYKLLHLSGLSFLIYKSAIITVAPPTAVETIKLP